MTQDNQRAIDKIKKLLAVANNTATGNGVEHEQETAMRQALALLAKHNLSMADVADNLDKEDRDVAEIDEEFPCPWRRVVAGAIARMMFCQFFFTAVPGKQKYKFSFVGLESNAEAAKSMTQWLLKSVYQESMKRQKDQGQTVAFGTTFRNAAGDRISTRCHEMRMEAEQAPEYNGGHALALTSLYKQELEANDVFIEKILGLKVKTKKVKGEIKDRDGLRQGVDFGNKVNLSSQLGTAKVAPVASLGA
jgi:hypothetical protein